MTPVKKEKEGSNQQNRGFFKSLDMFGIEPKLFINNKLKYQTNFGAFLTIALLAVLITAFYVYGNDIYYKKNPQVSYAEEFQVKPEHFKIKKDTMNFAVGLTGSNKQHYFDESIYTVKMNQFDMRQVPTPEGKMEVKVNVTPLKTRVCKPDDFGIAENYFQKLAWLEKLYCLDSYGDAFIEGDYGQDVFAVVSVDFYPCKNTTESQHCKPQEQIDEAIKDNYYSTYVSDSLIDPKNFTHPFTNVGRNVYGVASGSMYKQVDYLYRMVEINDNTGIIFDTKEQKKGIQFTTEREMLKLEKNDDGQFLKLQIRHEKIKKTVIHRTYLNLAEVLAKVGGILKVFMLIFAITSGYVAQKLYRLDIINTIFQFKYSGKINKRYCCCLKRNQKNIDEQFQKQHDLRSMKFSSTFQLINRICQRKQTKINKQILDHADHRLVQYLNISKILEKMMEIDKLKLVLFNSYQKKLFDYLPKPTLSNECLFQNQGIRDKETSVIQGQDLRDSDEKLRDALKAFRIVNNCPVKNEFDIKLLQILSKSNFLDQNKKNLDVSMDQYDDDQAKFDESQINTSRLIKKQTQMVQQGVIDSFSQRSSKYLNSGIYRKTFAQNSQRRYQKKLEEQQQKQQQQLQQQSQFTDLPENLTDKSCASRQIFAENHEIYDSNCNTSSLRFEEPWYNNVSVEFPEKNFQSNIISYPNINKTTRRNLN